MILNWLFFFTLGVVAYTGISYFAQITGGQSQSVWQAALAGLKPIPVVIIIATNVLFAAAVYMGFKNTQFAIPATIAVGIITSTVYSMLVLGANLTALKALGIVVILAGIFLLAD